MFSAEAHQEALKRLMKLLREHKTQSSLSFLSDVSREYLRCLERGTKRPSVANLINIIEASGLDLKDTLCTFVDMLQEENRKVTGNSAAMNYIQKAKASRKVNAKIQKATERKVSQKNS